MASLEGLMVQITRKAGMDGRLFGSVSNADVAEALEAQGFSLDKPSAHAEVRSKAVGDTAVPVSLRSTT